LIESASRPIASGWSPVGRYASEVRNWATREA
jgi:hypothetical protein